jgi:Fe-S oxidoreductase
MVVKLEDYLPDAEGCVRCSACKFIEFVYAKSARFARQCPISVKHKFNLYSAPGLCDVAMDIQNKKLTYTPKLLEALYECTSCGACDVRCKRNLDLDILGVIETLKARAVQDGAAPLPAHKTLTDNIAKTGNTYGLPAKDRTKWMTSDLKAPATADVLYFVGCQASYPHNEIASASAKILKKAGVTCAVSPQETCCGYSLFTTGQNDAFGKQVRQNLDMIAKSGAKTIICSCAECYRTLKVDYPKYLDKNTADMGFKVLHITEYFSQLIKEGRLKFSKAVPARVTYHDPCNLGRLSEDWYHWQGQRLRNGMLEPEKIWRRGDKGVYEQPREILKQITGLQLVEMERYKDNAFCCGGGAGVKYAFKEYAQETAQERFEEIKGSGAEMVVTCCPTCKDMLNSAAASANNPTRTYDITEIILRALE